jgi:hypothetical protein
MGSCPRIAKRLVVEKGDASNNQLDDWLILLHSIVYMVKLTTGKLIILLHFTFNRLCSWHLLLCSKTNSFETVRLTIFQQVCLYDPQP